MLGGEWRRHPQPLDTRPSSRLGLLRLPCGVMACRTGTSRRSSNRAMHVWTRSSTHQLKSNSTYKGTGDLVVLQDVSYPYTNAPVFDQGEETDLEREQGGGHRRGSRPRMLVLLPWFSSAEVTVCSALPLPKWPWRYIKARRLRLSNYTEHGGRAYPTVLGS